MSHFKKLTKIRHGVSNLFYAITHYTYPLLDYALVASGVVLYAYQITLLAISLQGRTCRFARTKGVLCNTQKHGE